ncbi:MAG: hypothetical protein RR458_02300, partial [Clostridia bacterium]
MDKLKSRKRALLWLVIALAIIIVSSLLGSIVQSSGFSTDVTDLRNVKNTSSLKVKNVEEKEVTAKVAGRVVSGLLYVPKTATAKTPAPAIVLTHGYLNNRELQLPFMVELARRGFVVLSIDREG